MANTTTTATASTKTKPHLQPSPPTFSFLTRFLFKSILIAVFLLLLPLFPSQAPDFFNHTLLTKFWELLHLLFIGIAVSYGLFGRRNMDKQAQPRYEYDVVVDNSESYISRINNFMSFSEQGYENPSGGFEYEHDLSTSRKVVQGEFLTERFDFNKQNGAEPVEIFDFEIDNNDVEALHSSGDGDNNNGVVSSWNSQYFQCEPMVVVSKPNYSLGDECVKPLGLPVRSLKSRVVPLPNFSSTRNGPGDGKDGTFDGFSDGPAGNLEKKTFEETESVSMPSPIPWGLRSGRIENVKKKSLHSRHLSVEVPHVRDQSSKSFRHVPSTLAPQVGSVPSSSSSSSPMTVSPSQSQSASAALDMKMEDLASKKSSRSGLDEEDVFNSLGGSSVNLDYKGTTEKEDLGKKLGSRKGYSENEVNANASSEAEDKGMFYSSTGDCEHSLTSSNSVKNGKWDFSDGRASLLSRSQSHSHSRSHTFGSFPEKMIGQRSLKNDLEALKWSKREEELSYGGSRRVYRDSLNLDVKPHGNGNSHDKKSSSSRRGKSVRTFRASERKHEVDEDEGEKDLEKNYVDKKVRGKQEHIEGEIRGFSDKEYSGSGSSSSSQQNIFKSSSILRNDGEGNFFDAISLGSDRKLPADESENLNVDEEEAMSDAVSVAGTECFEVDKKASEFIAKFREQIRLQKMASMEFSKELDLSELHLR